LSLISAAATGYTQDAAITLAAIKARFMNQALPSLNGHKMEVGPPKSSASPLFSGRKACTSLLIVL
jgi:hypothetical protein